MPFSDVGFQSSQVRKAINQISSALDRKDKIVLVFTGNIISSGLRTLVAELVRQGSISAIVTSGAGVEEDLIKTFGAYQSAEFDASAEQLIDAKLYRIGNLVVPRKMYEDLENFLFSHYGEVVSDGACDNTPGEIAKRLAGIRGDENSYLYWAHRNGTDVFCPTFHDGAIGDFLVDWRREGHNNHPDFILESVKLMDRLTGYDRCGAIILGGGTSKHFALNASVERGGYDWSVVISTAIPFDGSDSGGDAREAKTWEKLKRHAPSVHVFADATLVFPQIVGEAFFRREA